MSESLFSRKNNPGNDFNFFGSPIQSRRQAFLKRVLAFRNGDARVNQRWQCFVNRCRGPAIPGSGLPVIVAKRS